MEQTYIFLGWHVITGLIELVADLSFGIKWLCEASESI
jgi:hypothetical protein